MDVKLIINRLKYIYLSISRCLCPISWRLRSSPSPWTPSLLPITLSSPTCCPSLQTVLLHLIPDISGDANHCSPRDSYRSPFSDYPFVDFDVNTYQQLYEEVCKNYESRNSTVVSGIRNNFKEFFLRVSSMTYSTVLGKE